jgi:sulfatase modifying factor 1
MRVVAHAVFHPTRLIMTNRLARVSHAMPFVLLACTDPQIQKISSVDEAGIEVGEAGTVEARDGGGRDDAGARGLCKPDELRCSGNDQLLPQRCAADGTWQPNPNENGGAECPLACSDGACTGECAPDDTRCDDNMRQVCSDAGIWQDDRVCSDLCREGSCSMLASCDSLGSCGANESCCVSHVLPAGSFHRSYDVYWWTDKRYEATVSAFRLDRFEVTVGRFRKWMSAYATGARPRAADGRNPANPDDSGWADEWNERLPATASALLEQLAECSGTSWTEVAGANEGKPINCVTWHEAFAFCIWDQGRLPTEAEWNYAAAGGAEQRVFPWSTRKDPNALDETYAVFYPQELSAVGSRPKGDGKWGQADLAGNVAEWILDWFQDPYGLAPCNDCADLQDTGLRVRRGGAHGMNEDPLYVGFRAAYVPEARSAQMGFRCARDE